MLRPCPYTTASVSVIEFEFDWLCGIKICDGKTEYALINVYLPYDCDDNREDYIDCLAKLMLLLNISIVHASPS